MSPTVVTILSGVALFGVFLLVAWRLRRARRAEAAPPSRSTGPTPSPPRRGSP